MDIVVYMRYCGRTLDIQTTDEITLMNHFLTLIMINTYTYIIKL